MESEKTMWLLKLHFAVSVLCLLTFIGFKTVYKDTVKENGWTNDEKKTGKTSGYLIFFVPIMNILAIIITFIMICVKKQDFDKMCEEAKNKEESQNE